ncbi:MULTISPECIES: hypothetical protein [Rhodonellum]|uniref:Uncharacterized protein n=1 Tax=Rhodonellum ikkaensis TaxID=336829 RepID=A0A1H3TX03_9BACT|nr:MULTISPECIES: hypothetical protein [Rhodonellum]SDZ54588.1 hypothetical protein SAMN05444412_12247 [Rhodonellum ikkaensis]
MKTLLTLALAFSLGATSLANAANENITALSSVIAKNNKVVVHLKQGLGKVRLAILDPKGKQLHLQTIRVKKNDVNVPYDLSALPIGEYQVYIESNLNEKGAEENLVYRVETTKQPIALPLMAYGKSLDDSTIRLAVIGLEIPGVTVEIIDGQGKKVFKEEIAQPEGFTKIYHLDNLTTKDIHLRVTDAKGRTKTLYF